VYFNNLKYLFSVIYSKYTWYKPTKEKVIYLTFDDGPIPEITEYVLQQLKDFQAKATFFCVGDNVSKHPDVFQKIIEQGHKVGNHSYNHLNGWKTEDTQYLSNIGKADETLLKHLLPENLTSYQSKTSSKKLLRPPYGKIKRRQAARLLDNYEIIMWDVLTGDFDTQLAPEKCLKIALRYPTKGSIVIFHDSLKASPNLRYVLPRFLKHYTEAGYRFESL
jgi:peptidoglycan/xylan/chitin deacetylase (PgdA/CDA1 family)